MDVKYRSLYLIGILTFCHYYRNVSCQSDISNLHIEGDKKCSIRFDTKNIDSRLRGPKGESGEKGETGLPGLQGEKGNQGEKGMKGYKGSVTLGEKGEKGNKGEPGEVGPKGIQGDQGLLGVKGDTGFQGERGLKGKSLPGPPGITGDTGERGEIGPPGKKGQNGDEGFPGHQGTKGIDQTSCTLRKPDDTVSETLCDSDKPSGIYTIGPDGNSFQTNCIHNATTLEMCIRGNKTTAFKNHKSYPFWISEDNTDLRNIYELSSLQINWLQQRSEWARQEFIYHCENSVPYSETYANRSILLLSWNEKVIGPISTSTIPFKYDVPKASDGCSTSAKGTTVIKIEDTNTYRLPITDVRINDIRNSNQKLALQHVELCFGFKI